jgi:hypothetical protein
MPAGLSQLSEVMASPERLLSIAAEGGSIELYRDGGNRPASRYRIMVVDHTPTFLDDDEAGTPSRRDSGWLPTWAAAIEWLGRYPWPNLTCRYIDPTIAEPVWAALGEYVARTGRPVRDSALERWRRHCYGRAPQHPDDD